jgi:hypothetical protein
MLQDADVPLGIHLRPFNVLSLLTWIAVDACMLPNADVPLVLHLRPSDVLCLLILMVCAYLNAAGC